MNGFGPPLPHPCCLNPPPSEDHRREDGEGGGGGPRRPVAILAQAAGEWEGVPSPPMPTQPPTARQPRAARRVLGSSTRWLRGAAASVAAHSRSCSRSPTTRSLGGPESGQEALPAGLRGGPSPGPLQPRRRAGVMAGPRGRFAPSPPVLGRGEKPPRRRPPAPQRCLARGARAHGGLHGLLRGRARLGRRWPTPGPWRQPRRRLHRPRRCQYRLHRGLWSSTSSC